MEVRYKRSMSNSYIIIRKENQEAKNTYQIHILLENQVPGLLPCKIQKIDGEDLFYYEITGCQSFLNLYENRKLGSADLKDLFQDIVQAMEYLDRYLLSRDFLILNPAYIYRSMDRKRYAFLWFPFSESTIEKELRSLTEDILPKVDHSDRAAVSLGYGFYKEVMEGRIQAEVLKSCLYAQEEEEIPPQSIEEEQERQKILDDFYTEEEEETVSGRGILMIVAVILLLILLFFLVRHFKLLEEVYLWAGAGIVAAGMLLLGGVWFIKKKTETETSEQSLYEEAYPSELKEFPTEENRKSKAEAVTTVLYQQERNTAPCLLEWRNPSGKKYQIEKEVSLIGQRREAVDLWLDVSTVSRIHAKIIHREQGDFLIDLNSRNGTQINGEYLNPEQEYFMENGDEIVFAEMRFQYFC